MSFDVSAGAKRRRSISPPATATANVPANVPAPAPSQLPAPRMQKAARTVAAVQARDDAEAVVRAALFPKVLKRGSMTARTQSNRTNEDEDREYDDDDDDEGASGRSEDADDASDGLNESEDGITTNDSEKDAFRAYRDLSLKIEAVKNEAKEELEKLDKEIKAKYDDLLTAMIATGAQIVQIPKVLVDAKTAALKSRGYADMKHYVRKTSARKPNKNITPEIIAEALASITQEAILDRAKQLAGKPQKLRK